MKKLKTLTRLTIAALFLFAVICLLGGCSKHDGITMIIDSSVPIENHSIMPDELSDFSVTDVPKYSGNPFVQVNSNKPYFQSKDRTTISFEKYGDLDALGRCTAAYACIGKDIMPTEERGKIGMIKPSGWHTVKYDCVDGKYLYNRCHLIGYQLSGENANEKNLITGTRYLNVDGMLPFENQIADYVEQTNYHVLYRVTPIFQGNNLVASGVLMEALSMEDEGEGVCFNVYCYNVQPGVTIDYQTGNSFLEKESDSSEEQDFVVNVKTGKYHLPDCDALKNMSEKNNKKYRGTREKLNTQGYEPCQMCVQ